ncbi:MAG: BON domain-containing protein [bacterium]|nr:BON domain-containing protein [bacterium]
MTRLPTALLATALLVAPAAARDADTPPALNDPAVGSERAPGTHTGSAQERFEAETRPKSDDMLATAVHEELVRDSRVVSGRIRVEAREGVVTLQGEVDSNAVRDAAAETAQRVNGVRRVENALTVSATAAPAPGTSPIPERQAP